MSFLNSPFLWGGLAAAGIAVPIIIHLLHQRHRRQTDWAAMELLRRALVIRSGQVRLEDMLLLLLRCLVLALVAFALLRPTLDDKAESFLGEQRVGMVIAIDSSYSMGHGSGNNPKRMDKAKDKAQQILSTAKQGDPITIVLLGEKPRYLLRGANYDQDRCSAALDKAVIYPERLNLEDAAAELAKLSEELKASVKECFLVTDAQSSDWNNLSENAKLGFENISDQAKLFIVPVDTEGQENLAITRFEYVSGTIGPSGTARLQAEVMNFGLRTEEGSTIALSINDQNGTPKDLGKIKPGETKIVDFYATIRGAGDANLTATLGQDSLLEDNQRHATVKVNDQTRILCIDGEPSSIEGPDETFWLIKSLELNQIGEDAALKVSRFEPEEIQPDDLDDYDVVILANVESVGKEMSDKLKSFVDAGGGLLVFAGDRLDVETYNKRMHAGEDGLLPGKLEEVVTLTPEEESAENSWTLGTIRSGHVLAKLVEIIPEEARNETKFQSVLKVNPDPGATTILSLSDSKLPLLVEKSRGRGTVMLFACAADREWSNLVIQPLFPMLMQQTVTHLTNRPQDNNLQNVDPREGDVKVTENLEEILASAKAELIPLTGEIAGLIKNSRKGTELSKSLLILALLLFLAQGFLAKLFTSRMTSKGEADLQESLRKHTVIAARRT